MACACAGKNRATASGAPARPSGTYRVMVGGRKVYESPSEPAAKVVASRFTDATILAPGESA